MKKHNRKKSIRKWFRRNKKKILIAGGVALTAAGGVLIFKNKEALLSFINNGEAVANAVDMLLEDNMLMKVSRLSIQQILFMEKCH